jgi:hypothetical protein
MADGFTCDLEAFQTKAIKLLRRMEDQNVSVEALEQGYKALGIFYLNMTGSEADILLAAGVMRYVSDRYEDIVHDDRDVAENLFRMPGTV